MRGSVQDKRIGGGVRGHPQVARSALAPSLLIKFPTSAGTSTSKRSPAYRKGRTGRNLI